VSMSTQEYRDAFDEFLARRRAQTQSAVSGKRDLTEIDDELILSLMDMICHLDDAIEWCDRTIDELIADQSDPLTLEGWSGTRFARDSLRDEMMQRLRHFGHGKCRKVLDRAGRQQGDCSVMNTAEIVQLLTDATREGRLTWRYGSNVPAKGKYDKELLADVGDVHIELQRLVQSIYDIPVKVTCNGTEVEFALTEETMTALCELGSLAQASADEVFEKIRDALANVGKDADPKRDTAPEPVKKAV